MRTVCLVLLATIAASAASAAVYVPIADVPGGTNTAVVGLNNKNRITGYYYTGAISHGFVGPVGGPYETFDVGADRTLPFGINSAGTIVGNAGDPDESGLNVAFERWPDGKTVLVTKDHEFMLDGQTRGISNSGVFVGYGFQTSDTDLQSYYGSKGHYTGALTISQSPTPVPRAINASGVVVGYFPTTSEGHGFVHHGFILSGGVSTELDYPDPRNYGGTDLNGINDDGVIAGDWFDTRGRPHAFKYDMGTATYTPLHLPGTLYSQAWGINAKGLIVLTSGIGSSLYCPTARVCPL
ncbi:MAG TPA: hypothetical protein VG889_10010 [Rhizomicrobium sp.]|nr:hypothetical protein [Rhizomicrobium sp.]